MFHFRIGDRVCLYHVRLYHVRFADASEYRSLLCPLCCRFAPFKVKHHAIHIWPSFSGSSCRFTTLYFRVWRGRLVVQPLSPDRTAVLQCMVQTVLRCLRSVYFWYKFHDLSEIYTGEMFTPVIKVR